MLRRHEYCGIVKLPLKPANIVEKPRTFLCGAGDFPAEPVRFSYREQAVPHVSYARKYRPRDFKELIDQEHIATTLTNAIAQDNLAHAYLFAGPRGIGKTSTARILAKALNCVKGPTASPCNACNSCVEIGEGRSMDVLEIDGASNRGIDEIRTLRENVKFAPSSSRFKIYIIDEVHMLTTEAFNALLKTLEEPPAHVKFIFATTEPHKVLPTILSRCQRFDFRRISTAGIVAKLKKLCAEESVQCEEEALFAVARSADGSLRDAEVMIDQLNSFSRGKITFAAVNSVLGLVSNEVIARIAGNLDTAHLAENLTLCDTLIKEGKEPGQLIGSLLEHFRDMMLMKSGCEQLVVLPEEGRQVIKKQIAAFGIENILYCIAVLNQTQERMKRQGMGRLSLEMAVVKLSRQSELLPVKEVLEKLHRLEEKLKKISVVSSDPSAKTAGMSAGAVSAARAEPVPAVGTQQPAAPAVSSPERSHPPAAASVVIAEEPAVPQYPSAAAIAAPVSIDTVLKAWPQFVQAVKKKRMSLGIYLSEGRLLRIRNNILELGFLPEFELHRDSLMDSPNRKRIEEIAGEIFGFPLRIETISCDSFPDNGDTSEAPQPEEPEASASSEPVTDVNDIIQSAMDIFNGRLVQSEE